MRQKWALVCVYELPLEDPEGDLVDASGVVDNLNFVSLVSGTEVVHVEHDVFRCGDDVPIRVVVVPVSEGGVVAIRTSTRRLDDFAGIGIDKTVGEKLCSALSGFFHGFKVFDTLKTCGTQLIWARVSGVRANLLALDGQMPVVALKGFYVGDVEELARVKV